MVNQQMLSCLRKSALLLFLISICAFALPTPTLDLVLDKPQSTTVSGQSITFDGPIKTLPDGKKMMAVGEKCYSIPAQDLVGTSGTLVLDFAVDKMRQSKYAQRTLLILQNKSRLQVGFRTFKSDTPTLQFAFADQVHNFYFSSEKMKPHTAYQAAMTWDGEKVRCYFQGKLIKEVPQPIGINTKLLNMFTIGPHNTGYYIVPEWDNNDTFCGHVRIYKEALSTADIASLSAVKAPKIHERYPRIIAAPKRSGKIVADAELDDEGWNNAADIISVVQVNRKNDGIPTWNLPPHHARFTWDNDNLYLAFDTSFPAGCNITKGHGAGDKEAGVWGFESFELHLRHSGKVFYFGGTVNGGKSDSRDSDGTYNPQWTYISHLSHRIDDTLLWTGEVIIPWTAIELKEKPAELKMNFARSWFNSSVTTPVTDLACQPGKSYWAETDWFYTLRFVENGPTLTPIEHNDPSYGELVQKLKISSPKDTKATFHIIQEHSAGLLNPQDLFSQTLNLKAGVPQTINVIAPLTMEQADRLVYELTDDSTKTVMLRQDLPLTIRAEYLTMFPRFTAEKLDVKVKLAILKRKFGNDFQGKIVVIGPDGKEFSTTPIKEEAEMLLSFPKSSAVGHYKMELRDQKNTVISGTTFNYPGFGEWANMKFDMTRIIPPYQPLISKADKNGLTVNPVGRSYQWQGNGLLPRQITTQGFPLFLEQPQLLINGSPMELTQKVNATAKHRVDFSANGKNDACSITAQSWIEYDGVQFNEVELTAQKNLQNVELRFTLPRSITKYLHTSSCGWSSKLTMFLPDGNFDCRYFPVAILGNEDKCFCFFAESDASWRGNGKPFSFVSDANKTVFTVKLANTIKAGEKFSFDFGLLAGPVKPLAKNHPLDTAGDHYAFPMNRKGHAPTTWCGYITGAKTLSDAFADLPAYENNPIATAFQESCAIAHANNVHPFVYNPNYTTDEYPEVRAFSKEWRLIPAQLWDGNRNGHPYTAAMLCPNSQGADFVLYKIKRLLERVPLHGMNFDFGLISVCDNQLHGCHQRTPLIAYRNFFRRVALLFLDAGVEDYIIHIHNTASVQLPCITFCTHLLNGEHIRQQSSTLMHNGKDILDSYKLPMWAFELNTLPFGIYNSAYQSNDVLLKQYGGEKEDPELYKLRITRAFLSGMVIHNGISALNRCHFGIYDKLVRYYDTFGVQKSQFFGYWDQKNPAKVLDGKEVYASCYKHPDGRILAVISHIGNERLTQDVTIKFQGANFSKATELMDRDDPDYQSLFTAREANHIPTSRVPLKWENAGIKVLEFQNNTLKLHLPYHSFALVELTK